MKKLISLLFAVLILTVHSTSFAMRADPSRIHPGYEPSDNEMYWPWKKKGEAPSKDKVDPAYFRGESVVEIFKRKRMQLREQGRDLLLGVGSSHAQYYGFGKEPKSDYGRYLQQPDQINRGLQYDVSGCDFGNHFKEDLARFAQIGNAFRLSAEWSEIMPAPGKCNEAALAHLEDVCRVADQNGLHLVITGWHETNPIWFADSEREVVVDTDHYHHLRHLLKPGQNTLRLRGWEDEQNIPHFVEFCAKVFERIARYRPDFYTFNRPEGYALQGWYRGVRPPGKTDLTLAMHTLCNFCKAHAAVYRTLKRMPGGETSRIGMLVNRYHVYPEPATLHPKTWANNLGAQVANKLQEDTIANFLTEGEFSAKIPFDVAPAMANVTYTDPAIAAGERVLDIIGFNGYSRGFFNAGEVKPDPKGIRTDNDNYTIAPEGVSFGIGDVCKRIAIPLRIPVVITECGTAVPDDATREDFYTKHLYVVARLIALRAPIEGIVWWSGNDCPEWGKWKKDSQSGELRRIRYGLVHVDLDGKIDDTKKRRSVKKGSQEVIEMMNECLDRPKPKLEYVPSECLPK